MAAFETPFAFALNRLLESEPWARERLAPFVGETVELRAPWLPAVRFAIVEGGRLAPGGEPSLRISLRPGALGALGRGEDHFMREVDIDGNARLAQEVLHLAHHLRWDFEEDLSAIVGDAPAHALAQGLRGFVSWHMQAAQRLAEGLMEYALEEGRLLAPRVQFMAFSGEVAQLRDAVERLEKRLERLA